MFKKSLKYFAISFTIILLCLLGQLLFKYYEDLFFKGFGTSTILLLILYASLTLLPIAFIISAGITSALLVRIINKIKNEFVLKKHILKTTVFAILIGLLLLAYSDQVVTRININFSALLYDMRHTQSGEEIDRSDLDLFEGHYTSKTINEIKNDIDSIFLATTSKAKELKACLPISSIVEKNDLGTFYLQTFSQINFIKKMNKEIFDRYTQSGVLFVIIISGLFVGYFLRNKRNYIHIIIMTALGVLFYLGLIII